jgi:hypothetical protein
MTLLDGQSASGAAIRNKKMNALVEVELLVTEQSLWQGVE